jgi:predicted nucleic acid-binding protein
MAWDPTVTLIGDDLLAEEMTRYAELLDSDTAATTLATLISKMKIVDVQEKYVKICLNYIETPDKADIVHAAACLQTDATLISNDRHFDRIAEERIIRVLSIAEAIKTLES